MWGGCRRTPGPGASNQVLGAPGTTVRASKARSNSEVRSRNRRQTSTGSDMSSHPGPPHLDTERYSVRNEPPKPHSADGSLSPLERRVKVIKRKSDQPEVNTDRSELTETPQ
ncbi:unnamed protein product [Arctogadus glacialis]